MDGSKKKYVFNSHRNLKEYLSMKKSFIFLAALLSAQTTPAVELTTYVGFNAQMRYAPFKKGYGNANFQPKLPQGEIFGGFKINPYIGFELGYLKSVVRHKNATIHAPAQLLGMPNYLLDPDMVFEKASTSFKIEGASMSLAGFLPINEATQLLGSMGVARLQVRLRYVPLETILGPTDPADITAITRDFKKTKYIPQVKVGIQHMLSNSIGLRTFIGWDGTKRFNLLKPKQIGAARASLKDSYNLGLGLTYYFH